jgi:uncharacterized protein
MRGMNTLAPIPLRTPSPPEAATPAAEAWRESVLPIRCHGHVLPGILAEPAGPFPPTSPLAMIVVVGGPQYRAGSHRHFVGLSRHVAAAGIPVLRFDVRGMGDAEGDRRSFEDLDEDIGAALDALLARQPPGTRAVLWGLCDGASASLLYLDRRRDPRVAGLVLLNPWVRSEATLARTQVKHYYAQRLLQPAFWSKLLCGGVGLGALSGLWHSVRVAGLGGTASPATEAAMTFQQRMARQWRRFDGHILLLLSGNDYTAREFEEAVDTDPAWRGAMQRDRLKRVDLPGADHTLSDAAGRLGCEAATLQWLNALAGPPTTVARR